MPKKPETPTQKPKKGKCKKNTTIKNKEEHKYPMVPYKISKILIFRMLLNFNWMLLQETKRLMMG